MKKSLFSLFALTLGLLLAACSSKQKENTGPQSADLTVEAMEVYGDSPGILSVVPGTYKLNVDDKVSIKIKLKLEQTVTEAFDGIEGPNLRLKTADGVEATDAYFGLANGEGDKLKSFLKKDPGAEEEFVFELLFDHQKGDVTEAIGKIKTFTLDGFSLIHEEGGSDAESEDASSSADDDTSGETMSSAEVDQMLDNYEELVDSYTSLVKKASATSRLWATTPLWHRRLRTWQKTLTNSRATCPSNKWHASPKYRRRWRQPLRMQCFKPII